MSHSYLNACLTPLLSSVSGYNLYNSSNYGVPFLQLKSYFPSTFRLWNNIKWCRQIRDRMVVGLLTTYAVSVPIGTKVVSSNPVQARCTQYNIM